MEIDYNTSGHESSSHDDSTELHEMAVAKSKEKASIDDEFSRLCKLNVFDCEEESVNFLQIFSPVPKQICPELEEATNEVKDVPGSLNMNLREFSHQNRNFVNVNRPSTTADNFLNEAEAYLNQPIVNTFESTEMCWKAFSYTVAMFYQQIGIDLLTQNSTEVMSYVMIDFSLPYTRLQQDLFAARECAFNCRDCSYGNISKKDCFLYISNIRKFVAEAKKFKPAFIEQKIKEQKIEGKKDWIFKTKMGFVKLVYKPHDAKLFDKNFKFDYYAK